MHCSIDVAVGPLCDVGESAQRSRNRCCLLGHGHRGGGGGGVERSHVLWEEELQTAGGTTRHSQRDSERLWRQPPVDDLKSHWRCFTLLLMMDVVCVSYNVKIVGIFNMNMQPEDNFLLLWRFDALRKHTVEVDSCEKACHCFSGSWGKVGWLATRRLLVQSQAERSDVPEEGASPWLLLTSWLSPYMGDSAIGLWMRACMWGSIVKGFEWPLVRTVLYKCSPFTILQFLLCTKTDK